MGRTACTEPQCLYKGARYSVFFKYKYTRATVRLITQHTVKCYCLYFTGYLPGQVKFQLQVSGFRDVYILYNLNQCPVQQIFLEGKVCFEANLLAPEFYS